MLILFFPRSPIILYWAFRVIRVVVLAADDDDDDAGECVRVDDWNKACKQEEMQTTERYTYTDNV